jgi:hypothetical protein
MDNKIKKNRLQDFFTYHWITLICVILAVVFIWEVLYTMFSVRLTVGQRFKYYYDQNIYYANEDGFDRIISSNDTFSYDVIVSDYEFLSSDYNVLSARLSIFEGDAIFTDSYTDKDGKGRSRAKDVIDGESVISFEKLLDDGINYLESFIKPDLYGLEDAERLIKVLDYQNFSENFDESKIYENFIKRYEKDNRFRTSESLNQGVSDEIKRIKNLVKEIGDFKFLLENAPSELFLRYTRFEQAYSLSEDRYIETFKNKYDLEVSKGRVNLVYGLKLDALSAGENKKNVKDYFRIEGFSSAEHVVLLAFDFTEQQPDLQFETISFINTVVRTFSTLLDAR